MLRKNARWSNGQPVTAEDFRYAWLRVLRPETASSNASSFLHIKGAKEFNQGKTSNPSSVGIEVPNPHTIRVTLENKTPRFLEYVQQVHYAPVPRSAIETYGATWTQPDQIVTNGAYILKEWIHRSRLVFEKNPNYWENQKVRIPRVLIHLGGDRAASWTRYQQLKQHVVMDVSTNLIPKFLKEGRPDFFIDNSVCYVDLIFNVKRPPFDSRKVRQAFSIAIDKERYVELLLGGLQLIADGPVPAFFDLSHNFPNQPGLSFDPDKARELLSEAGYPNALGLPAVTLIHNTSPNHVQSATFVQASLRENLGVKVDLRAMEHKSLLATLHNQDFQFARYARCHPKTPYPFLEEFRSDSTHNHFGYHNETVDQLLKKSLAAHSQSTSIQALGEAEKHIQKDAPHIPLYTGARSYLKVPVLRGWVPESGNRHLIQYMYWGDKENETP